MFRNGIYKIFYRSPLDLHAFTDHALAVVRDGKIIGADRLGAVFIGAPGPPTLDGETVSVDLRVPPGGELISGLKAGPDGAIVTVAAAFDPAQNTQSRRIDIAGSPVDVRLDYLGPLPD
jgi:hypothetical protein